MDNERDYLASHPWITFRLDLREAPYELWMELGEVASKIQHVSDTLLPRDVASEFLTLSLIKGVQSTTAIEGNTLTEDQVRREVLGQRTNDVPPSQEYQQQEVRNVVVACNDIAKRILDHSSECELSFELFASFNRMVLKDLPLEEGIFAGQIPSANIVVGNYRGAPRKDCQYLLERLSDWINKMENRTDVRFAVLHAILAHLYFVWIHPFGDGNGRTARLLEILVLGRAGVPLPCAHLLSNHYNKTRSEYYRQLSLASKKGEMGFIRYAVQGLRDGLVEQIEIINSHQWRATWKEHVYESFDRAYASVSNAARRQRQIALDLWNYQSGIPVGSIPKMSPRVEKYYDKLSRNRHRDDIAKLVEMGLADNIDGVVFASIKKLLNAQSMPKRIVDGQD
ncbi:MAG: Fic family protein [Pirellulaceae bacterium]